MLLWPLGQPENDITVVSHRPDHSTCAACQLKGAVVSYMDWQLGSILIQSVPLGHGSFVLYHIHLKARQMLTAAVTKTATALWFVLKGNALVFTEGVGQVGFREGDSVLVYNPAGSEHYIRLKRGNYWFACVELDAQQVARVAAVNGQLAYFSAHSLAGEGRPKMQLTANALPERDVLLNQLIAIDYQDSESTLLAQPLADALLNGYIQRLQAIMRSRKMNSRMAELGQRIQEYIEANCHRHLTRAHLVNHFNVSDFTIDEAFVSISNQTIKQYIIEQQLLKARKYLMQKDASVKCCARDMGTSYNCLLRNFKWRFGQTPSACGKL